MFLMTLAEEPFVYKNKKYDDFYNYFILKIDEEVRAIMNFDLMNTEFLSIDCQESDMYYDGLIRASLNYFSTHGYDRCLLSGDTFDAFKNKYRLYHVLDGDYVLLEPFFNLGCGVK